MDLSRNVEVKLNPEDEYCHPIEAAENFNESMYINCFDHKRKLGGWFRVGNRPNEGYAEMSCCIYLPDGRVGFMFKRPEIDNNDELNAGGMRFRVSEPFKKLEVTYKGSVCLMENPQDMEDPKKAFSNNPVVKCEVNIQFTGVSPMFGGEKMKDGKPLEEDASESFARAHYEQHMSADGTITVDGETFTVENALGLRDHSWGPRYWQNLYWYRWLPMSFTEDFAMNVSIVTMASGKQNVWGMVLRKNDAGEKEYVLIDDAKIESVYDENNQAISQKVWAKTPEREYHVTGKSLALIPLRNRRQDPEGNMLHTRITEAMSEFECDGITGMGMSEYLDQIVDGKPVGTEC